MKSDDNVVDVSVPVKKAKKIKPMYLRLLALTVAGAAILGVYFWQTNEIANVRDDYESQISDLQDKIDKLQKDAKSTNAKKSSDKTTGATEVSATVKANVEAAISSKNTAALESYMADSVKVIIAASEGIGDRTPVQAVNDLDYLNSATDPWDFDLPAATIDDWQTGDYASYFPETLRVIGRSSNSYVVVFKFNASEKITDIFMAVNDDLL
ncbi:hypothetical protein H6800_00120 [Candidatus Nomurabacteria bacterium]|nr:hypothetical protein [Candidatus Nomurabacteria bacterium]